MRFRRWHRTLLLALTLIAPCAIASPVSADFVPADIENIPANIPAFIREFQAFLADFPRWDAAHLELPLVALAMTPEQQRPEMLLLLWDLWMHDHPNTSTASFNFPSMVSLSGVPQPGASQTPGAGNGGGTVASTPGGSDGSGEPGGPSHNTPEPSSLALLSCGSLGLIAYRLVRSRTVRGLRS